MSDMFEGLPFRPADILLPRNCDLCRWSVVACDQYTSQPEYWERVERRVGDHPSALRIVLPESRLKESDVDQTIQKINRTMVQYLEQGIFESFCDAMIYVERTLKPGKVRKGLVGMVDLEQYDYQLGCQSLIRATEGTVLERIPPRVKVRQEAALETPHVLMLMDDPEKTVLEPLGRETASMRQVYSFELMEGGGQIRGWLLREEQKRRIAAAMRVLQDPEAYRRRYGLTEKAAPMLFAVGDGNHSLATAKACWEKEKKAAHPDLKARYALVEVENLYDPALEFEPIHRVVSGPEPEQLLEALRTYYPGSHEGGGNGHRIEWAAGENRGVLTVPEPTAQLTVGTLQNFLDEYLRTHPEAGVDYIHGECTALTLAKAEHTTAFILPAMDKKDLFPTVIQDGVLPRKTFSMGSAQEKRFYLEARRIRG